MNNKTVKIIAAITFLTCGLTPLPAEPQLLGRQPRERGDIFIYDMKGNMTIGGYTKHGRDAWTLGPEGYTDQTTDSRGNVDIFTTDVIKLGKRKGSMKKSDPFHLPTIEEEAGMDDLDD